MIMTILSASLTLSTFRLKGWSFVEGLSKPSRCSIGIAWIPTWCLTSSIVRRGTGDSAWMMTSQWVANIKFATASAEMRGDRVTTANPARKRPKHVTTHSMFVGPRIATLKCSFYVELMLQSTSTFPAPYRLDSNIAIVSGRMLDEAVKIMPGEELKVAGTQFGSGECHEWSLHHVPRPRLEEVIDKAGFSQIGF